MRHDLNTDAPASSRVRHDLHTDAPASSRMRHDLHTDVPASSRVRHDLQQQSPLYFQPKREFTGIKQDTMKNYSQDILFITFKVKVTVVVFSKRSDCITSQVFPSALCPHLPVKILVLSRNIRQ